MSVSYVARKLRIAPGQLFTWRRRMAEGSREAIRADDEVVSAAEVRELKRQAHELQRVLGKRRWRTRFFETPFRSRTKETNIAVALVATGRYAMKAIADTLGIARSNLVERASGKRPARSTYRKNDDELLPSIREIVALGPRMVTAGLRRCSIAIRSGRSAAGQSQANLPYHGSPRLVAAALHRPPDRARSRRSGAHAQFEYALVL